MARRVFKYATGQPIPENAKYLSTVTQTSTRGEQRWVPCWLVWHYFLIEDES